jgi:hypothetical protein
VLRVAIILVFIDYHRRGAHHRTTLQPQIGPLIAALLPDDADIDIINDTWTDPDWSKGYDLVFLSCVHSDFDRARQMSHYYRMRGAVTVLGGSMASSYPKKCAPYFDAVVIGDPEDTAPQIYRDAKAGELKRVYRSMGYNADLVPTPRCDLAIDQQIMPLAMEATRGCPCTCDFCALPGSGARFKMQAVDKIVRDVKAIDAALKAKGVSWFQRQMILFYDNNLAGNLGYLRALCDALEPLGLYWSTCLTFNVLTKPDLLKRMYDSGCRSVFVGLESFNPAAIADFGKHQNRLSQVQKAFDNARAEGIIVTAGLMLSPLHDDVAYIRALPRLLKESGLHVPSFVCIESAIPETPLFDRLAFSSQPMFMPHTSLHDYNAYSLVIKPAKCETQAFIDAYQETLAEVFCWSQRWGKLTDDIPRLLKKGSWVAASMDVGMTVATGARVAPGRTYWPLTDVKPHETVPLSEKDFVDEAQFHDVMGWTLVTDGQGRALPGWHGAQTVAFAGQNAA